MQMDGRLQDVNANEARHAFPDFSIPQERLWQQMPAEARACADGEPDPRPRLTQAAMEWPGWYTCIRTGKNTVDPRWGPNDGLPRYSRSGRGSFGLGWGTDDQQNEYKYRPRKNKWESRVSYQKYILRVREEEDTSPCPLLSHGQARHLLACINHHFEYKCLAGDAFVAIICVSLKRTDGVCNVPHRVHMFGMLALANLANCETKTDDGHLI